jgi:hypothetical protein
MKYFQNNRIIRICGICNKKFKVIPYIVKIGKGKFCSRKCADINHKNVFRGIGNPAWKRGKYKSDRGYVYVYYFNHPFPTKQNYIYEHRLIMEKYLNRYLFPEEVVHHINGIKDDNRIENLELFSNHSEHMKLEHGKNAMKIGIS